jgi:hypothetical protein
LAMHERVLHGLARTVLTLLSRRLARYTGPQVKLH